MTIFFFKFSDCNNVPRLFYLIALNFILLSQYALTCIRLEIYKSIVNTLHLP